jgi:hypothetical protein
MLLTHLVVAHRRFELIEILGRQLLPIDRQSNSFDRLDRIDLRRPRYIPAPR